LNQKNFTKFPKKLVKLVELLILEKPKKIKNPLFIFEREKHWKSKFGEIFQEISKKLVELVTLEKQKQKSRKTLFFIVKREQYWNPKIGEIFQRN
jgi:translation initiation factor IF-3